MAVDRETYAEVVGRSFAPPAYGGFVPPGMPGHVPDCCLPFNPVRARELLAEAGFPQGRNFPKTTLLTYPHRTTAARFLVAGWRKHLAIDIEPEGIASPAEDKARAPYIGLGGWLADYPDPDNFLRVDVELTLSNWHHTTYQNLLMQASKLTDQTARLALYRQAELILAEEACLVPYIYDDFHLMLKPWVKKFPTAAVKNPGFWKDTVIDSRPA